MIKYIIIISTCISVFSHAMDLKDLLCTETFFKDNYQIQERLIELDEINKDLIAVNIKLLVEKKDTKTLHFLASSVYLHKFPIPVSTSLKLEKLRLHPEHNKNVPIVVRERINFDPKTGKIVGYNF